MLKRLLHLRGRPKNLQFIASRESLEAPDDEARAEGSTNETADAATGESRIDAAASPGTESPATATTRVEPLFARPKSLPLAGGRHAAGGSAQDPGAGLEAPPAGEGDPSASSEPGAEGCGAIEDLADDFPELALPGHMPGHMPGHIRGFTRLAEELEAASEQQLLARAVHGLHRLDGVLGKATPAQRDEPRDQPDVEPPETPAAEDEGGRVEGPCERREEPSEAAIASEARAERDRALRSAERERARSVEETRALRERLASLQGELDRVQLDNARYVARQRKTVAELKRIRARAREADTLRARVAELEPLRGTAEELDLVRARVEEMEPFRARSAELEAQAARSAEELDALRTSLEAVEQRARERARELRTRDAEQREATERLRELNVALRTELGDGGDPQPADLEDALAACAIAQERLLNHHAWRKSEMADVARLVASPFWRVGKALVRRVTDWSSGPPGQGTTRAATVPGASEVPGATNAAEPRTEGGAP